MTNFKLTASIQEEIKTYAQNAVASYCENVATFRKEFSADADMAACDLIETCFNGNDIDYRFWDLGAWGYTCEDHELEETYKWIKQTGCDRFGEYELETRFYNSLNDLMILVAYFWITENVEVVTEMIRDFYNEHSEEDY